MNTEHASGRMAQPAPEELKKHGDQLERQVRDAAGKTPGDEEASPVEGKDEKKQR